VDRAQLTRRGVRLEQATLGWNVVGVIVLGIAAGRSDSAAAVAFALDSAVEIGASVVVIWELTRTHESRRAIGLRLIGAAFVLVALLVTAQATWALVDGRHPGPTGLGIVWTALTLVAMLLLASAKSRTGAALGDPVLSAEARVTLVDAALAATVLTGLALNAAAGWWWADPLAGLVIVGYAIREAVHIFTTPADAQPTSGGPAFG
jgi:divalent metal cation (Fe/Co/Zn/Cd) transporter